MSENFSIKFRFSSSDSLVRCLVIVHIGAEALIFRSIKFD